jgi:hypothetical protein
MPELLQVEVQVAQRPRGVGLGVVGERLMHVDQLVERRADGLDQLGDLGVARVQAVQPLEQVCGQRARVIGLGPEVMERGQVLQQPQGDLPAQGSPL